MPALTIEIDDKLLSRVEELARLSRVTIPEMATRLLAVRSELPLRNDEVAPLTRQATGMSTPMSDEEVKIALDEYRMRKYGGE